MAMRIMFISDVCGLRYDGGIIPLIDFVNNLNNILIIYDEKFTLKVSVKLGIILIHYINSFIMVPEVDSTLIEVVLEQHPAITCWILSC
ncbi:MAG: hypothetical protein ACTS78_00795 [Arsenophonus sp. NC-WZS1-MAG3]